MITVYTIPNCIWCERVKARLEMNEIGFTAISIIFPEDQRAFCEREGVTTFPQTFDGNMRIGGHDDTLIAIATGKLIAHN